MSKFIAMRQGRLRNQLPNETGILLSIFCFGALVILLVSALLIGIPSGADRVGLGSVLLGLYLMAWGCMYLVSYYFSHKAIFFRALIWQCEHASVPANRKMALFYFLLAFVLGAATLLGGLGII